MKINKVKQVSDKTFRISLDLSRYDLDKLEDLVTVDQSWLELMKPKEYKRLYRWALKFWIKLVSPCDNLYYKKKSKSF